MLAFCIASAQKNDNSLREHIRKLDQAHASAILHSDAAALDSLMSNNITVNHPTNRIVNEKAELMKLIGEGVIKYTSFERTPETFLFYTDMIVVMGSEIVTPAKGAPNEGKKIPRRYTNIWMQNNGKWKLTIRHAHNVMTCK